MASLDETQAKLELELDKYEEEQLGLPVLKDHQKPKYLYMSIEELRKVPHQELAEASFELNRYSFYIERVIGKNKAWEKWAKAKLDELMVENLEKVPNRYGYNERPMIAKHGSDACKKLNSFIRELEMKLARLYNVPKHVNIISDSINNIRYSMMHRDKND